jgi:hypothetical protein
VSAIFALGSRGIPVIFDNEKAGVAAPAQLSRLDNADIVLLHQSDQKTKLNRAVAPVGGWRGFEVATFNGQFDTNIDTGRDYNTTSLGDVFCVEPTNRAKAAAPAFIPSLYCAHDARNHQAQRDRGLFVALTGDIDKGNISLARLRSAAETLIGPSTAFFIYSTGSAKDADKRWRYIIPLSAPMLFDAWQESQEAAFSYMETNGVSMDWSLARAAQPVYLPNVPPERRGEDGQPHYFERFVQGGGGLDLANAPVLAAEIDKLRALKEADDLAKRSICTGAAVRRPVSTVDGDSPIEAFNRSNAVEDLLIQYGYEAHPNGKDWQSRHQQSGSHATRIFEGEDGRQRFVSLSGSDVEAGLGVKAQGGGCYGDSFDLLTHYEHNGDRGAAIGAVREAQAEAGAQRRKEQREENAHIGSGPDAIPLTEIFSAGEMLERYVFIRDGSQVADKDCPQAVLNWGDFKNAFAGSKHHIANANGSSTAVAASKVWLESPDRKQADTLTFHAGAGLITKCPSGRQALNIWRLRASGEVPDNWEWFASYFLQHVVHLWDADADSFIDWLAHIEQKPGILPHFGWLHISRLHGTGRNWVASVLTRLWAGNVAASLDLTGLLDGGFNDRLSRCLLGIVDEVNEGGAQKYRTANRLRQLVTAEVREINPKYGRKRIEHNAARWLIFSNHAGALPLDETDRRFWVVNYEGEPKEASYYVRLYRLLNNSGFLASVREFLLRRDISGFNPGQRPPMNAAKTALVEFSQSEEDAVCKSLVAKWPVDVITASELNAKLPVFSNVTKPAVRHAMDGAGIRKVAKIRHATVPQIIYALRNHDQWSTCNADQIRDEIDRASEVEKNSVMEGDDDG